MKVLILRLVLLVMLPVSLLADGLKPYVLAGIDQGSLENVQSRVNKKLISEGFTIVGSYTPAQDESLGVICVTHNLLKASVIKYGGLMGFTSVLRVGLHETDAGVEVSFTAPLYWGNAYCRKQFPEVEESYEQLDQLLRKAFADLPETRFEDFGSKKGHSAKKLQKYHYMMSMPHFDDVVQLDKGSSYEDAVSRIESRATEEESEITIVYSIKYPEQQMALFGTAIAGEKGEAKFLPKIDISEPRHVPFLPYELLVLSNKVVALHGKYRIALSFPDLSMGTFMKIMSTPGDIADAQRKVARE